MPEPEPLHALNFPVLDSMLSILSPLPRAELEAAAQGISLLLDGYLGKTTGSLRRQLAALAAGELDPSDAGAELRALRAKAVTWRAATLGEPADGEPTPDPSGLLRGYLLERTADVLMEFGIPHWALNLNGAVICSGSPTPSAPTGSDPFYGIPWRAGITDPFTPGTLVADVPLAGTPGFTAALATSAATPGAAYEQVSVLGPDILEADVLAAAIHTGGPAVLHAVLASTRVNVLVVHHGGALEASARWPGYAPSSS